MEKRGGERDEGKEMLLEKEISTGQRRFGDEREGTVFLNPFTSHIKKKNFQR